jgi:hypothetical protein
LLLRHDVRYEDSAGAWTARHRAWLTKVDLGQEGAWATLLDYLGAIDALVVRRDALEASIAELVPGLAVGADGRQVALPARDRQQAAAAA